MGCVSAEMPRPTVSPGDWGGYDVDMLRIAALSRTILIRLKYLHICSPVYCLKDRSSCRFFYPWGSFFYKSACAICLCEKQTGSPFSHAELSKIDCWVSAAPILLSEHREDGSAATFTRRRSMVCPSQHLFGCLLTQQCQRLVFRSQSRSGPSAIICWQVLFETRALLLS